MLSVAANRAHKYGTILEIIATNHNFLPMVPLYASACTVYTPAGLPVTVFFGMTWDDHCIDYNKRNGANLNLTQFMLYKA